MLTKPQRESLEWAFHSFFMEGAHAARLRNNLDVISDEVIAQRMAELLAQEEKLRVQLLEACQQLTECLTKQHCLAIDVFGEEKE